MKDIEDLVEENARLRRIVDAIRMDRHAAELAMVARYKFASDETIAAWARAQPDEKTGEIARLARLLAREQAKSEEVAAAHSVLIMRLQTRRAAMSFEDFVAFADGGKV